MKATLIFLAVLSHGCIIGTWPTPEAQKQTNRSDDPGTPLSPELCDGVDNDADGVTDEGCPCEPGELTGCAGVVEGECGFGVHYCEDGLWSNNCEDILNPSIAARTPSIVVDSVEPASMVRDGPGVVVTANVLSRCAGMQPTLVWLELTAQLNDPEQTMTITSTAHGDSAAGDNRFVGELINGFGPGVPAQTLTLRASVSIGGDDYYDEVGVELVEP